MIERQLFDSGKKINSGQFGKLFSEFKLRAFRLETFPEYKVPEEADQYKRFTEKAPLLPPNTEWYNTIKSITESGKIFQRVRVLHRPIQDYLRFEIITGYLHSIVSGEQIFFIEDDVYRTLSSSLPVQTDFWTFDDDVLLMWYDQLGRYVGGVSLDVSDGAPFLEMRENFLRHSEIADFEKLNLLSNR